ncbi:isoprenylcysteine carboxylmethyltransferase family protein [bacterium]|nr:isoprenylcysteine carboxylmethyltransferase family protein [bacterium]
MPLKEEFERAGNVLFRGRSYYPLLAVIIIFAAMVYYKHPGNSELLDDLFEIACMLVAFFGEGIRFYISGHVPSRTSGRNTHKQVADVINKTGLYSIVRHPLYLGNFFIVLGISMVTCLWWFVLICVLIFWLYYERIAFAEEEFLREKFGDEYLEWANRTPAFIPHFKNWIKPEIGFSLRTAIKKEYSGVFGIIAVFTFFEIVGDIFVEKKFNLDLMWSIIFFAGLIIYLVLMFLKKKTKILSVKGR